MRTDSLPLVNLSNSSRSDDSLARTLQNSKTMLYEGQSIFWRYFFTMSNIDVLENKAMT